MSDAQAHGFALASHAIGNVRSMIAAGVRVAGSSDAPVQPSFDPLVGVHAAVTRSTRSGAPLHPEEAVDVMTALSLYTREAAHAAGRLDVCSTLEPGKRADLVILSADPRRADTNLERLRVDATIVGGRTMHPR